MRVVLYEFEDGYVFAAQSGVGLKQALPAASCALGVVALLVAFDIGKGLLQIAAIGGIVWVAWQMICGIAWFLHEIPISRGRKPPTPREEKPPEEKKKKDPKWLQILEDDDEC